MKGRCLNAGGKFMYNKKFLLATLAAGLYATAAQADTCVGSCGVAAPDGVVTAAPPNGPRDQDVPPSGGVGGAGEISSVGGTDGSEFTTSEFSSNAGDKLNFYFNYVTSDGSGTYTDYAFAELLNAGAHAAWLFTARTTPTGDTSPGFGLPSNDSTLTPSTTPIVPGGPEWSPLGASSGACYSSGCGYTGWIGSTYTLSAAGSYSIRFGVTNIADQTYDSGLAFAGLTINDVPVEPISGAVPEPAGWAMMMMGIGGVGAALRRRRGAASLRLAIA